MTWWLSASAEALDAARTCRRCGSKDADIDLGLCFYCFSEERKHEEAQRQEYEWAMAAEYEREMTGRLYEHMEDVILGTGDDDA